MIKRLTSSSDAPIDQVGGKAAGLVRLLSAGLTVPEAWVIPATASQNMATRKQCLEEIEQWWDATTAVHPDAVWAIRSSAVAEDLEDASFAGVYETKLGVASLKEMRAAIRHCWQAHESSRADVYRGERQIGSEGGIALVVQRMVRPRVAGVLLTANPQRPFADEIVIDAAWGLGESIVSGKVDPDHYVLERSTGHIRSTRIATKTLESVYDTHLHDREVEPERQCQSTLNETDLAALYEIARRVEKGIGEARDLEWAIEDGRVYSLQDRAITNLPKAEPDNVWSRKWGDEYKSEYALPLSAALTARWMNIPMFIEMPLMQGRNDIVNLEPFKLVNGYMYMNGQYAAAMARAFPKAMREQLFGSLFTPMWMARINAEPWKPLLAAGYALAPYRDHGRGSAQANLQAMQQHCATIDTHIVPKLRQDYSALSLTEWRRQVDEVDTLAEQHFRIIRWGMAFHNHLLHGLLVSLLSSQADDDGQLYTALISGLPGTYTARINTEIWELAMQARSDPQLLSALRNQQTWAQIQDSFQAAPFVGTFQTFLLNHGHRSSSREIASPRWSDEPEGVLGLIRAQISGDTAPTDPRLAEQQAEARRTEAFETAVARIKCKPVGSLRVKILKWVCQRTQTFTVYRENQRYYLDYLIAHLRALVLEQARRLADRGLLDSADDVFLLLGEEFFSAVATEAGDADPIDRTDLEVRRRNYLTYRSRMSATYLFDDIETEGEVAEGDAVSSSDGSGISGIGVSRGVARGRTRCIAEMSHLADITAGDVLIAKTIDPGWTSVFPLLAGLITETGGTLSHGAILAREYGIPTVTAVPSAMTLLPTGTAVEIDGSSGLVQIISEESAQDGAGVQNAMNA
ncbi:PEP/pyruvate-binding domain-containing protein [Mycobacterium sp. DL99]|uniref:PEP/pyruvate-binding domain-containing protein n=1 Tax=Mycobacterium sp. DL99 TaxID=2528957 RepID=UPI0010819AC7|nr:PEP/pyruvate-binding domain-containing protein [Mycobacterium sp. DL99]